MESWWSERPGAVFSLVGAVVGVSGAVLGTWLGWVAYRRGRRSLTRALAATLLAVGVLSLAAGIVAYAVAQPHSTWYPLVFAGVVLVVVMVLVLRRLRSGGAGGEPTSGATGRGEAEPGGSVQ